MALEAKRGKMEEVVVAPVENSAFLDPQPASVALVSLRGVRVSLLCFHGEVEELPPQLSGAAHELRADAVVHRLEEAPVFAGVGDGGGGVGAEVDDRNGVGDGVEAGKLRRRLYVSGGDDGGAALGDGLDPNDWFGPVGEAVH